MEKKKYDRTKYKGIYIPWVAMKQRCNNPNTHSFKNYGGRGITYCPKWEYFEGFKEDMEFGYKKGLTLERIDNNKGYFKENCKWATRKEQGNNKRTNLTIKHNSQKKTLSQWADSMNMNFGTLRSRYYRGMSIKEIFKNSLYRPQKL